MSQEAGSLTHPVYENDSEGQHGFVSAYIFWLIHPSSLSWDKSVACAWPSPLAQRGEPTHLAHSSFCESLKWLTEDFLFILKKPHQTPTALKKQNKTQHKHFLSGRINPSFFHYQTQITVMLFPWGGTIPCTLNWGEGGTLGTTVPQSSVIPSSAALSVHGNKATHFVSKLMPPNPAYLQCKLYIIPKLNISWFAREDLLFHFIFK